MSIRGQAYIVGAYEHPDRVIPDKSVAQIHAEVTAGVLADAGLRLQDIDGLFITGGVGLESERQRTPVDTRHPLISDAVFFLDTINKLITCITPTFFSSR